jgi:hypothetical protein
MTTSTNQPKTGSAGSSEMPAAPGSADTAQDDNPDLQGEGNYTAARRHRKSAEGFVDDGKVEPAARDAEPADAAEAQELRDAEREGKARARK